ncbi:hypothetical protein ACLB9X_32235 [Streptomyces sp. 5K101]|uniref:hypothetical protein n=1 Tax=Streptomyces sp. 5K101 TaxID=3390037 RepID=UPI0039771C94
MVSLVVGFGAVLVIDYFGLLWLTGKHTLGDVLRLTNSLHAPVWVGMAGLVLTGLFLNPDLSSTLTRLKVAAVLVIALNGICATALQRYLTRLAQEVPSQPVLLRGAAVAAVSQAGWWLAVVVGFLNSRD